MTDPEIHIAADHWLIVLSAKLTIDGVRRYYTYTPLQAHHDQPLLFGNAGTETTDGACWELEVRGSGCVSFETLGGARVLVSTHVNLSNQRMGIGTVSYENTPLGVQIRLAKSCVKCDAARSTAAEVQRMFAEAVPRFRTQEIR